MKIAIIGYGKMGRQIEAVAKDAGHQIVLIIDKDNSEDLNAKNLKGIDVAIEFSTPDTAFNNIMTCLNAGIPTVSGTTGWLNKLDLVKEAAQKNHTAFFYASNFSIGVNLFFKISNLLAKLANGNANYKISIEETHHTAKMDAPSGTAITLAQNIIEGYDNYKGWSLLPEYYDNSIPIKSIREGTVPGTHSVLFDSEQDQIILTHKAKDRKGFAIGAVLAAQYSIGKQGFLTMDSLLNS